MYLTAEELPSTRDWIRAADASSSGERGATAAVTRLEDSRESRPTPKTRRGTMAIRIRKSGCFRILLLSRWTQRKKCFM
jgi:hypothetical protein